MKTGIQIAFGKAVRKARIAKGWSQEELAEKAGLHRTYIGSIERGERNLSLENIVVLADTVGLSAMKLMEKAKL